MRKRERQEKILSSTLAESLILFLFILLTVANIYKQQLEDGNYLLPGQMSASPDRILKSDQIAIDKKKFDDLKKYKENFTSLKNKLDQKDKKINKLLNDNEKIKELGISCPPCTLSNGRNFILFDVDYLADTTYLVTMRNISKPMAIRTKIKNKKGFKSNTIYNGEKIYLKHKDFVRFGQKMIQSKLINQDDPYCKDGNANRQSAWCLECMYVFQRKTTKEKLSSHIFNRRKKVDKELALFMHNTVNNYFFRL